MREDVANVGTGGARATFFRGGSFASSRLAAGTVVCRALCLAYFTYRGAAARAGVSGVVAGTIAGVIASAVARVVSGTIMGHVKPLFACPPRGSGLYCPKRSGAVFRSGIMMGPFWAG